MRPAVALALGLAASGGARAQVGPGGDPLLDASAADRFQVSASARAEDRAQGPADGTTCYLAPRDRKFAPGTIAVDETDGFGVNRSCRMSVDKVLVGDSNNEQPYQRLCVVAHAEARAGAAAGGAHETCAVSARVTDYVDDEQLSDWDMIPRLKLDRSDLDQHPEQPPMTSIPRLAGSDCGSGYHLALGATCVADYCPPGTMLMDGACRLPAHMSLIRPEGADDPNRRRAASSAP